MSWDIFVQDLPSLASSISEIPADFAPRPLPVTRSHVIAEIRAVAPFADSSDPAWVRIEDGERCLIEVNLGTNEQLNGFAFHVYGGDLSPLVIAEILQRLHLRALDPGSKSGFFEPAASAASFAHWQRYRKSILSQG